MTPAALAWRCVVRRPAATLLSALLIALGVAAIAAMLLVVGQANRAAERNAAAADLVIGATSSPMQLVLSGIFHLDAPPAPFAAAQVERALGHASVERWVPIALGDSLDGYRLVGTRPEDFAGLYGGKLAAGQWPGAMGNAVLGADVARRTGLAIGARFGSTHGLAAGGETHEGAGHQVAGVLARTGTVLDKLALVPIESVWAVHATGAPASRPDGMVSMILVQLRSPLGAIVLPRLLGFTPGLQVASPAQETAKLFSMLQLGADGTLALGGLLLGCAALAVCAGLLAAHRERARDVAVLRLLGASPRVTLMVVVLEASFVGLLGAAGGLLLAHAAVEMLAGQLPAAAPALTGMAFDPLEIVIALVALLVSWTGAALPAWRVQRAAVADVLKTF